MGKKQRLRKTKDIGDEGERFAADYLLAHGYELLTSNYRYGRAEIDLIVQTNNTIIFVEVKFRKNNRYGFPETFVSNDKAERIKNAAEAYVVAHDWNGIIRFDLIAITASSNNIHHIKDAF